MRTISFTAKCADAFGASLTVDGEHKGEYSGYVPQCLSNDCDYVELTIDIDTGKIVNWKKPTAKSLAVFK